jgi:tRNA(Ile2)-agmatinylcytidine synthase
LQYSELEWLHGYLRMQASSKSSVEAQTIHIGLDDTDSTTGKCTTHAAYTIIDYLLNSKSIEFIDYPLLIRLNPNIPWKTRGNGAVCLRFKTSYHEGLLDRIVDLIHNEDLIAKGANPGLAVYCGDIVPFTIQSFARRALCDIVSRKTAQKLAARHQIRFFTDGNGQGLIGSIAAIGTLLQGDHTFEAVAYRKRERCGTVRKLDSAEVVQYDAETFPYTFNNYDKAHQRVLILPHGPDPVFCGIRGESAEIVCKALRRLRIAEKLEGYVVFRTNQGTNLHLQNETGFTDIKCYKAGFSLCRVNSRPSVIEGGHAMFSVKDSIGAIVNAAVYEPTDMVNIASKLEVGDVIKIGFGVRRASSKHPRVLNIEYLQVLETTEIFETENPICLICSKRMKSEGLNKGFCCRKCGFRDREAKKTLIPKPRMIENKLYVPTPRAHRHLTKPIHRYGMEKNLKNFSAINLWSPWFSKTQ